MYVLAHPPSLASFLHTHCSPSPSLLPSPHPPPALQVYASLEPQAYFLRLADSQGAGLRGAWAAFSAMQEAIGVLNWYYALNGISILLLIAR
jgi:hypothetical protein